MARLQQNVVFARQDRLEAQKQEKAARERMNKYLIHVAGLENNDLEEEEENDQIPSTQPPKEQGKRPKKAAMAAQDDEMDENGVDSGSQAEEDDLEEEEDEDEQDRPSQGESARKRVSFETPQRKAPDAARFIQGKNFKAPKHLRVTNL